MPQIILMGWFTQDKEDPQKPFLFTDQYDKNDNLNP